MCPWRFPADYPILMDFYSVLDAEYQRLSGRSRIWGRPLNGFLISDFPIKAPTRQMLYPLSYRGALPMSRDVSMSTAIRVNRTRMGEAHFMSVVSKSKRPTHKGRSLWFVNWLGSNYAARGCSVVSAKTRRPFNASSMISRTAEVSGLTSIRSQARRCRKIPSVAISRATPVSFEYLRA